MRKQFQNNLPQLKTSSQIRFRTASKGHSYTEQGKNKDDSKLNTLRQQNSTSYASKVIKYQTSGVIYSKKKEEEQIRLKNIEDQIKSIEKQLQQRRDQITHQNKNRDTILVDYQNERLRQIKDIDDHDVQNKRKKLAVKVKNVNLNDPKQVKTEIDKIFKNIQHYKKKINNMKNDNNAIQIEVDKYRKQINTIKEQVINLDEDLEEQNQTYETMIEENKLVSQEVVKKHLQLHQRKSDKAHEQTKKLKKYDEILKSITREIEDQKLKTNNKPAFYITQINYSDLKSPTKSPTKRQNSPSKRRYNLPLSQLQTMLHQYQQQFQKIKEQAGTDNFDEIGQQYVDHQKQTYAIYKFTNGLSQELRIKYEEQQQLKKRLAEAQEQSVFKYSNSRQVELDQITSNLEQSKKNTSKYRSDFKTFNNIIKDLKLSIPVMVDRLRMIPEEYPELLDYNLNKIEEKDLIPLLIIIQKRKNQLMENNEIAQPKILKLNQNEVEEQIQSAKKEFAQYQKPQSIKVKDLDIKHQKFLDQNQMVKTIDLSSKSRKEKKKN